MTCKQQIIIAIGTNVNQERNMKCAKYLLTLLWRNIRFTSLKWTEPIGMHTDYFYNCLAYAEVEQDLYTIKDILKNIETKCGNTLQERALQRIQIDIDIIKYGTEKLHVNDWDRPYVQELLKEIDFQKK